METSQPLSIESFSYSWLVNLKPSLDGLDGSLRASLDAYDEASSFIEMDPRMPPSRRFFRNSQDFKFDFPISQTPLTLVHADELFSDGRVMPFFVNPSKIEAYRVSDPTSSLPTATHALNIDVPQCKTNRHPLRRCRRLSKRIFSKYLNFLRPLYRSVLRRNKSSGRAESVDARGHVRKNWLYSAGTSPRISVAYSAADEWRKSCDSESSIYEAVLHCKKSIGK
ncbi:hypothetical protein V6N13_077363 [Hibiscus sabdariffa]|uniref:Membrane-associated kinase regulator 6 n=2 Tax=Hibiscus sabdariffa TaxID=183260 RepID=A0ABR2CNY4_9ROSI